MSQHFPILSILVLFFGAFVNQIFGRKDPKVRRNIVLVTVLLSLIMILVMAKKVFFEGEVLSYWLGSWSPQMGQAYGIALEIDALGLFFGLIIITAVLASTLYSFEYMSRDDSLVNYYSLFLILCGGVLGMVFSGDLFNIFIMVEIMTFSAVALVAFRNTKEGALEAAFKYLVVGSVGSTSVLIGTILLYAQLRTLNLAQIAAYLPNCNTGVTIIAFAFLFVGFSAKAFIFPFQPLAADAHGVAPSSISVMISGVLTKTGVYGIIRLAYVLYQNMDKTAVQMLIVVVGSVSMVLCVVMALQQHDFKRLLAFHSISQVGYVITAVGLSSALGLAGGLYHAMNHTLFKSLLFLTAGAVLHQTGTTNLDELGGLSKRMPKTTALFLIGAFSISGIPPFNGFASKWMIYEAAFTAAAEQHNFVFVLAGLAAMITSVLTLASFIKVAQSAFFGQLPSKFEKVQEVPNSMIYPMGLLAALCCLTGLFPGWIRENLLEPAVNAVLNATQYIDTMMGEGIAENLLGISDAHVDVVTVGTWSPLSWLLLLVIVTAAVFVVLNIFEKTTKAPESTGTELFGEVSDKYEPFFSGEKSVYSQVGGSDLFWGFKKVMHPVLAFLSDSHSGVVNDYTRWALEMLAFVLLYALLFIF